MNKELETGRRALRPHSLVIEGRQRATVYGVEELDCFHEQQIILFTELGTLTIEGEGLHIDKLNLEEGQLIVSGTIFGAVYTDEEEGQGGFLSRLWNR